MGPSEQLDLIGLLTQSMRIIEKVCNAEGFNVGVNLGKAAGAGFEDHLHVHIVPRWDGDMNFMPILADTKVISEHLNETYDRLVVHFNDQSEENP
jgi:ATP adenylyltransferase